MAKRRGSTGKAAKKTNRKTTGKTARRTARTGSKKTTRKGARKTARAAGRKAASGRAAQARKVKRTSTRAARPSRKTAARTAGQAATRAATPARRRALRDVETVAGPPSSLNLERKPSAARSGRKELKEHLRKHTATGPAMTGGDIDANWETAYSSGDEAPGGDNPTPDQDRVDDIGRAIGVQYEDNEQLKGADKISQRDRNRWELDPASSEDYGERTKRPRK